MANQNNETEFAAYIKKLGDTSRSLLLAEATGTPVKEVAHRLQRAWIRQVEPLSEEMREEGDEIAPAATVISSFAGSYINALMTFLGEDAVRAMAEVLPVLSLASMRLGMILEQDKIARGSLRRALGEIGKDEED